MSYISNVCAANILKKWGLNLTPSRRRHGGRDSSPGNAQALSELELTTNFGKCIYQVDHKHFQPVSTTAVSTTASTSANITGRATRSDSLISGDVEKAKFSTPSASVYSNLSQLVQGKQSQSGATKLLKKIAKSTSSAGISSLHDKADKSSSSPTSSQSSTR